MPDGVVHTRCNNRRASRCQPCSRLYQGDAWQLILAGLTGGKGVPGTVAQHPMLFVTLTAPSFGPVHTRATDASGRIAPRRARRDEAGEICEHGRPVTCTKRHAEDDPELGRPLCVDCWDYAGAVLWNAHASELWRRTRIRISRELAILAGVSERACASGHAALDEARAHGLGRIPPRVRQVRSAFLTSWTGRPVVRELDERLRLAA